jgi:hypothetical protein
MSPDSLTTYFEVPKFDSSWLVVIMTQGHNTRDDGYLFIPLLGFFFGRFIM